MSDLERVCRQVEDIAGEMTHWASALDAHAGGIMRTAMAVRALTGPGPAASELEAAARRCQRAGATLVSAIARAASFTSLYRDRSTEATAPVGNAPEPSLSEADLAAMKDYTGDGYAEINSQLRSGVVTPEIRQRAEALSAALAKLPDYDGAVFRGTFLTEEQIAPYEPGTIREESAFTSTTRDEREAFAGNTYFVITSKHGKDVSRYSRFPDQAEVLFDKGSRFYVHSNGLDPRLGKRVIVLIEV
jgi:ADP-ribosyltransferase exoenzyme